MSYPVIRVENLSKKYLIGHLPDRYATFRDVMVNGAKNLRHQILTLFDRKSSTQFSQDFWALKNVSFDVKQGELVGIIGRNGAGKSTLLKVLSRITQPTQGRISLNGRVASLLEVGTGFHPELTGRENIFLNGAILGMSKVEIKNKFDEIVDFAEIEKFIDTPVKRYSSGMYVRLAFAVAAHLEPEILIVDEVLAVGDVGFQKKCLGKMGEVSTKEGRTVLFVSHNLQALRTLCSRGILLDGGQVEVDAPIEVTLKAYSQSIRDRKIDANVGLQNRLNRTSGAVRFTSAIAQDVEGNEKWEFKMGEIVRFNLSYQTFEEIPDLCLYLAIRSTVTNEIITTIKHILSTQSIPAGQTRSAILEIPDISLRPGDYSLYIYLSDVLCKMPFDVIDENVNLPYLVITSEEPDPHRRAGFFSIPSSLILR